MSVKAYPHTNYTVRALRQYTQGPIHKIS